jgi:hypothetical protein
MPPGSAPAVGYLALSPAMSMSYSCRAVGNCGYRQQLEALEMATDLDPNSELRILYA